MKEFIEEVRRTVGMVKTLWPKTPSDCRFQLIEEALFNPRKLERRYQEEIAFQEELARRFKTD